MDYAMKEKNSFCGQREGTCSCQFLGIMLVMYPPVWINQQVFGLCKKDFEDINSLFI